MVLTIALALSAVHIALAAGPNRDNLRIGIFLNPDIENQALEDGTIDINDWPLAKEWVQRWLLVPEVVTLKHYAESAMFEFDMNNQKWPTGHFHQDHFFDPNCEWCIKALKFRLAIAYLTDKKGYIDQFLSDWLSCIKENLAVRLDLPLPRQQHKIYWPSGIEPYQYNKAKAIELLDSAGFTLLPSGLRQDPMNPGKPLEPLVFFVRIDDAQRVHAATELAEELASVGIQTDVLIRPKEVCYHKVMVEYNYHLYTGAWYLEKIPDQYYDLYHSSQYWGPNVGWSPNYVGFCNHEFDGWAEKVKHPADFVEARTALRECGRVFLEYCPAVPLWTHLDVKAYRTGWKDVMNDVFNGVDNYFSFFTMNRAGDNITDWGFKADIEQLNVVSTGWPWDRKVLDLIYDSLVRNDPILGDPTRPEPFIATGWVTSSWNATDVGGDPDATLIVWALRPGVKWHDGTDLTIDDLKFTIDFTKRCGAGVAWNYPLVADVNDVVLGPGNSITVYMKHKSAWAVERVGSLPIIRKSIWELIKDEHGHDWTDIGWNSQCVKAYDPLTDNVNNNLVMDIKEDGAGAWSFVSYVLGTEVDLAAWRDHYFTPEYIKQMEMNKFHKWYGDVDYNGCVNIRDLAYMARALGTDSIHNPHGTGWNQYNPDCDLDQDGDVDLVDFVVVTENFGECMGC
jgi:ABC-type transport system substrate-binding protein